MHGVYLMSLHTSSHGISQHGIVNVMNLSQSSKFDSAKQDGQF